MKAEVTRRPMLHVSPDGVVRCDDDVAVEEPLAIRISGEPLAITMRTPGDDRALVLGFLAAEGIIASLEDISSMAHCGRPGHEGYGNVIDVIPAPLAHIDAERLDASRRDGAMTSACGVCGRREIDDLLARIPVLAPGPALSREAVSEAAARLRAYQPSFARTGGLHAAAAFDRTGQKLASAEDIGRHNAVDKVVGTLLLRGTAGGAALLFVSGRTSFEIVQKAAFARIPVIAGVGAASSLAIDLADRAGVALVAFARDGRCNLYTHPERLVLGRAP
jgi:FdhD protein